jgi:signal transduction histidine kinase
LPRNPRKSVPSLRRLADEVLEAPDVEGLVQVLSRELLRSIGVASVTILIWNRKLDSFETLTPSGTQRPLFRSEESGAPRERYLITEGQLIETPGGKGEGALVPLMARSGLIGMLVLGPRRRKRDVPYRPSEVRQLCVLASRCALALENHLYHREVVASERLAALGTMAGMLVHDFRGPMTVIRGYAETLLDPGLSAEELRSRVETITQAVDRLERMTNETLDFAREGSRLARRSVVIESMLDDLQRDLPEELPGLTVVWDSSVPSDARAALDVDKLRRAVSNIAANARDAMGGGGRLHVTARLESGPPGSEQRGAARDGSPRLVILLADEGPGIPPEIRDRVFEPFVTKGKKGGTGLGLAVSRRFVEDHGGSLELLDEGPGARFRMSLPLEPPAAEAGAAS